MAEGRGFEPLEAYASIDFKSTAFDHSASPPCRYIIYIEGLFANPPFLIQDFSEPFATT